MLTPTRSTRMRFGLGAMIAAAAHMAGQAPQPDTGSVIRSSVHEVVLDLTARNKNGKMIRDLRGDEVEVLVDGVHQNLRSFQLVKGEERGRLETPAPATLSSTVDKLPPPNSAREINLVALVFRTSNTEQRGRALKAAIEFISGELRPNTYIAVLTMTQMTTRVTQSFTSNRALLAAAINRTLTSTGLHEYGAELAALVPPTAVAIGTPVEGPTFPNGGIDPNNVVSSRLWTLQWLSTQMAPRVGSTPTRAIPTSILTRCSKWIRSGH